MFRIFDYINEFPANLKKANFLLFFLVFCAVSIGVIFIYGTGQQHGGSFRNFWIKQLVWFGIGSCMMLLIAGLDYKHLGNNCWLIYAGTILLLITVLIFGNRINGAKSWLPLAPGLSIQPSEFAKLGLLVIIAQIAARPSVRFQLFREAIPFIIITAIPVALIVMQPDMGSAIVLIPIALSIMFISGIKKRWLVYGVVLAILAAPAFYKYGLKTHQKKRVLTFLNPGNKPTSEGWNARQSLLAVGSGGVTGKGFMKGTQNVLGFLPKSVAPTDFIFSVIAEEAGFIGSTTLILNFLLIMLVCIYIAMKARDDFGRNLACGIAVLLCVHIYINIGMTIGMAPIIGIPLPFVSYGGSFMILTMCCVGVLQSVYIRRRLY